MEDRSQPGCTYRVRVHLKVVPGSSRVRVLGRYGDRVRVSVGAPPENGEANRAVERLLAEHLGIPMRSVRILSGQGRPLKTIEIVGVEPQTVARLLYGDAP